MAKIYEYVRIDIDTGEVTDEVSYDYEGSMAMCGGGGTSGSFDFPTGGDLGSPDSHAAPTDNYRSLVDSLIDLYRTYYPASGNVGGASGGGTASPFGGETSPNPNEYMGNDGTKSQARMDKDLVIVDDLNPSGDFTIYASEARTNADIATMFPAVNVASDIDTIHTAERTSTASALTAALTAAAEVVAGTPIAAMVTAYETRIRRTYVKAMSRISAGFADINAVNSSAFVFALASIERQMIDDVNHYDAQLSIAAYNQGFAEYMNTFKNTFSQHLGLHTRMNVLRKSNRDLMILGGVRDISQMLGMKLQANNAATHLQLELNRIRHASEVEKHQNQLGIDEADAMFPGSYAIMAGNALATAGGAAMLPPKMSKTQSIVSGIAAGAGIGMEVGGPKGAGIGAIVGGIAGAL